MKFTRTNFIAIFLITVLFVSQVGDICRADSANLSPRVCIDTGIFEQSMIMSTNSDFFSKEFETTQSHPPREEYEKVATSIRLLQAYEHLLSPQGKRLLLRAQKCQDNYFKVSWNKRLRDSFGKLLSELPEIDNPGLSLFKDSAVTEKMWQVFLLKQKTDFGIYGPILAITEGCFIPCSHCDWAATPHEVTSMPFPMVLKLAANLKKAGINSLHLGFSGDPFDYYDPYYDATLADVVRQLINMDIKPIIYTRGPDLTVPVFRRALEKLAVLPGDKMELNLSFHLLQQEVVAAVINGTSDAELLEQKHLDRYKTIITALHPLLHHGSILAYPFVGDDVSLSPRGMMPVAYTQSLLRQMFKNKPWPCEKCKQENFKPLLIDKSRISIKCISVSAMRHFGRGFGLMKLLGVKEPLSKNLMATIPDLVLNPNGSITVNTRFGKLIWKFGELYKDIYRYDDGDDYLNEDLVLLARALFSGEPGKNFLTGMVRAILIFFPDAQENIDNLSQQRKNMEQKIRKSQYYEKNEESYISDSWITALRDILAELPIVTWGYSSLDFGPKHSKETLSLRAFVQTDVRLRISDLRTINPEFLEEEAISALIIPQNKPQFIAPLSVCNRSIVGAQLLREADFSIRQAI